LWDFWKTEVESVRALPFVLRGSPITCSLRYRCSETSFSSRVTTMAEVAGSSRRERPGYFVCSAEFLSGGEKAPASHQGGLQRRRRSLCSHYGPLARAAVSGREQGHAGRKWRSHFPSNAERHPFGAAPARTSRRSRSAPIYAAVLKERYDFAWMISFSCCLFRVAISARRNDGYRHLCMMQNSARNRSQKYAAQAMSLVSSDDNEVDMLANLIGIIHGYRCLTSGFTGGLCEDRRSRNSLGDWPKMRLNTRLNWVSDWKPTS
jgi:hypothetical protein